MILRHRFALQTNIESEIWTWRVSVLESWSRPWLRQIARGCSAPWWWSRVSRWAHADRHRRAHDEWRIECGCDLAGESGRARRGLIGAGLNRKVSWTVRRSNRLFHPSKWSYSRILYRCLVSSTAVDHALSYSLSLVPQAGAGRARGESFCSDGLDCWICQGCVT